MILKIEQGPDTGSSWTAVRPDITIGRDAACDVPLQDERASHHHAQLWQEGEHWWVKDLNSTNGTWVNGKRLTGPYRLQTGDQLRLGETAFSVSFASPSASSEPRARSAAPPNAVARERSHLPRGGTKRYTGDAVAGLVDGLIGLAALLLIAGAFLPWIRISINVPFVGAVTATPAGTQGMGTYTMIGGVLSLALVVVNLIVRAVVLYRRERPAFEPSRLFLRWSGMGHLLIASSLLLLGILGLLRYYRSASREVFLGIRLIDLFDFALNWLDLRLIPQIGLILTGLGLGLLLLSSVTRLAVALLVEKPFPAVSRERRVLKLALQQDAQPDLEYEVADGVTLGRSEDNNIVIQDDLASRHHAAIRWWDDGYVLVDLESKNGIFVNGQRIATPHLLRPGDQIQIGRALFLTKAETEFETAASVSGSDNDLELRGSELSKSSHQHWLWPLVAIGGLLFLAAIVGIVLLLSRDRDQTQPPDVPIIEEIVTAIPLDILGDEPILDPQLVPTMVIPGLNPTAESRRANPEVTSPALNVPSLLP
jgi:pSer/pThr/pTyr-binding forkhead associated (FHA) protein